MQAELPPAGAPPTVSLDVGDHSLSSPSSTGPPCVAKKAAAGAVPPIDVVNMLTNTLPNTGTPTPADTYIIETNFLGLKVGAKLAEVRTRRGQLALELCRLLEDLKAATGREWLSQDRVDACMEVVNRCLSPSGPLDGVFDGITIPTEAFSGGMGPSFLANLTCSFAAPRIVDDLSTAASAGENENDDEDEDEDDEDEDEDEDEDGAENEDGN